MEIFVYQQGHDNRACRAGCDFDELSTDLQESKPGQIEEHEAVQIGVHEPFGGENIEGCDDDAENQKPANDTGGSKVYVALHDRPDADACAAGGEGNTGEARDQIAASRSDGFV